MKQASQLYKSLVKQSNELDKMPNTPDNAYYKKRELFVMDLRELIYLDFGALNKKQVFQIMAWTSTYRPVALHSFLIYCSQQNDKLKRPA